MLKLFIQDVWSLFRDKIVKLKPFSIAVIFSPWAIILYLLISDFTETLPVTDLNIIEGFIEWFGTAYSLFLALVLVNVWNQFETLNREFDREADAIATLFQTVNYAQEFYKMKKKQISEEEKKELDEVEKDIKIVIKKIEAYAQHVIDTYQIEHKVLQQRNNGEKILEGIGKIISSIACSQFIRDPLITELYRSLNEARDMRGDRITHSKQRIPPTIWLVAIIASLVWLFSFFGLVIKNPYVSGFIIIGVAFVIIIVLIIIGDLGNPFGGTWNVEIESWHGLLETLDPNPRVIFVVNQKNKYIEMLSSTSLGETLSITQCNLSKLSRETSTNPSWESFISSIQELRQHQEEEKTIRCDFLYSNEFVSHNFYDDIDSMDLPTVILKNGDDYTILLDSEAISGCTSVSDFEKLFNENIKNRIPWY